MLICRCCCGGAARPVDPIPPGEAWLRHKRSGQSPTLPARHERVLQSNDICLSPAVSSCCSAKMSACVAVMHASTRLAASSACGTLLVLEHPGHCNPLEVCWGAQLCISGQCTCTALTAACLPVARCAGMLVDLWLSKGMVNRGLVLQGKALLR